MATAREINYGSYFAAITSVFKRYLFTQNWLPDDEHALREAFWEALGADRIFARAPLLTAIPSYRTSRSLRELTQERSSPRLHPRLTALASTAFDVDRALYAHQVSSIARALDGRNVVVATGTGSGKTECFLLPILEDALRHPGPGVRAIVVYPLNALANDQLERLRKALAHLPEVTFGRYTGDTPWKREPGDPELTAILEPNERYSRDELRSHPPHILLTNFAMLEYLLLRPRDTGLFDEQRLQYVVLDEAHTYSGAQGIDVSLLMRRLRLAFPACGLRYILTSATLGDDLSRIASFGAALTGADFTAEDVVLGERTTHFAGTLDAPRPLSRYLQWVPDDASIESWLTSVADPRELRGLVKDAGVEVRVPPDASTGALLGAWLGSNAELQRMHELLSTTALSVQEVAEAIFADSSRDAQRVVEWLVLMGARARPGSDGPPLLPARFHGFFRGLRGATVCLANHCTGPGRDAGRPWSHLMLEDRLTCSRCAARVLPLSTCVHCGIPVVRITEVPGGRWLPAGSTHARPIHLLTWNESAWDLDDDEALEGDRRADLCMACGSIAFGVTLEGCCDKALIAHLRLVPSEGDGNLKSCPACGGSARPFPSVLRGFGGGEDGSTAVLAEAVIRALPVEAPSQPADGRRLLVFSDSRQRAAHFAPYLARTSAQTQYLAPLWAAIRQATERGEDGRASFDSACGEFLRIVQAQPYVVVRRTDAEDGEFTASVRPSRELYNDEKRLLRREAFLALLENFTAPPRIRNNMGGLGLATVEVDLNQRQREDLPSLLPEAFESGTEAGWASVQALLSVFVSRRALTLPEGVTLRYLAPGPELVSFHRSHQARRGTVQVWRWNPYMSKQPQRVVPRSPQAEIVAAIIGREKTEHGAQVSALLDRAWEAFRDLQIVEASEPNEYQIPSERLLLWIPSRWFRCARCGLLSPRTVRLRCLLPNCGGEMRPVETSDLTRGFERHHWRQRATITSALPLEVREHTAQLTKELGRQYQRQFMAGRVNVLSSSTTFEMGVDVGQLRCVFLRNVPPTAANYIQRAGRAGRRQEGAAYAITFARSIPHDQTQFDEPLSLVRGEVPVPRINLANTRLTQRHVNSLLLGRFLRSEVVDLPDELTRISADWFFFQPTAESSPATRFVAWVTSAGDDVRAAVATVVSSASGLGVDECLRTSVDALTACGRSLTERLDAYRAQEGELQRELTLGGGSAVSIAIALQSVRKLLDQLLNESIVDALAGGNWLPGYAFPQDVVRLVVRDAKVSGRMRLERDVEYGLSEYSPGAEVVADGKLLRSGGVDLQNREMEIQHYRSCGRCHQVQVTLREADLPRQCAYCEAPATGPGARPSPFIVPRGFTTLVEEPATDVRVHRVLPPRASEVFLLSGAPKEAFLAHPQAPGFELGHAPHGELFRANPGRDLKGFKLCRSCGRALSKAGPHRKPWGARCAGGQLLQLHLACRFATDTLQIRFNAVRPAPPGVDDQDFWLSWQMAFLVAAAEVLEIPQRDLGGTYRSEREGSTSGELVVFDRVPGGAGYVAAIDRALPAILRTALMRARECRNPSCDSEGSCYSCLRTYENQFLWTHLQRRRVADWLSTVPAATSQG